MEKKKEKADLEQLLNSLIEKGWKPRHCKCTWVKSTDYCLEFYSGLGRFCKDERLLTSKESWLWQFVCENGMVGKTSKRWEQFNSDTGKFYWFYDDNSTYRLIESALCDEDKLEEFLLNSIKLD
jgi:hypothetical protein